jgi:hypothetical protein
MMYSKQRPPTRHHQPLQNASMSRPACKTKRSRDPRFHDRPSFQPAAKTSPYHLISSHSEHKTMLASPFYHQSHQTPSSSYLHQTREFLPKIPSPLSPRSANIHGSASSNNGNRSQQPNFMSSENDATTKNPQSSFTFNAAPATAPLPYSKRAIKRAPAVSQDALTERRRGMFLKKVREGREDKRFERHGEDVSICLSLLLQGCTSVDC